MRTLGLDMGTKRIGVAMSDAMGIVAQGVKSIEVKDDAKSIEEICDIVRENAVGTIVIGLPLNMDGSESPMSKEVARFVEKLREKTDVSIKMWDERLSSLQVERDLVFMDVSRKKRKKINDMLAAQVILQSYLDSVDKRNNLKG